VKDGGRREGRERKREERGRKETSNPLSEKNCGR